MTRILIVEDEGIIARDLQQQLLNLGYDAVDIAVDGEEAIAFARDLRPQLVLMDIHLPGRIDGIEAATTIRKAFQIPSVFLTAYATNEVVERAKQADPWGYIIKPFDAQILRTTIEIALNKDRLDRELRKSEARLAETQRIAHLGSWETNLLTGVTLWSDECYAIANTIPAGTVVTGAQFFSAIHPDGRARVEAIVATSISDGEMKEAVVRVPTAVGGERVVFARCQTFRDASGTPVRSAGTLQDITSTRKSEELLRLQSAALNSSTSCLMITDREGTIQWVNPAFTAMSGYSLDEALGRNPRDLVRSGAQDDEFYKRLWATILDGGIWAGELTNRRKDGSLHLVEQTITPVRDESGTITHFVGVNRDLTEQKRLEQQFLQAQKMEVIGRLAGGVAHDFNNLITIINGTCELALMELPIGHPLRAEFDEIQGAGDRAAQLTKQLLTFSRKQLLTPAVVNVGAQASHSAGMLRRLIGEDIDLVIRADPAASENVFVDPSQLEQVLLNLAVNARDAMPNGGVLTIETSTVDLSREFADAHEGIAQGLYVVLSVTDTGIGMPPEVRDRIFEPFFTTKEPGKGTGLGLATVYGVVHQSGGTIEVTSEPGRGSCFRILMPRIVGDPERTESRETGRERGSEKILLVEDESALRDMTARMLDSAGYRVLTARNGEDALALAQSFPQLDLVITDVVMPGMSGPDLARRLSTAMPGLRVLFVSGYTDDKLGSVAAMNGANFLPKPFTMTLLTRKVRQILDSPPPA